MKAVRFQHDGLCCAIPPSQVLRGAAVPEGPVAHLFGPPSAEEPPETFLEVRLAGDLAWIGVSELELEEIERPAEMSRVASGVVRLPHVVGWVEQSARFIWLVDLRRYRPSAEAR